MKSPVHMSVYHLLSQEIRRGLQQFALNFSGIWMRLIAQQRHTAGDIAPCNHRCRDGHRIPRISSQRDDPSFRTKNAALLHNMLQFFADAPVTHILFCAAGHRNDRIPITDGTACAGRLGHGIAQLRHKRIEFSHWRILFENDFSVSVGINLKRIAFPNPHGSSDFFWYHNPPEIIPLCQVGAKKFYKLSEKPLISMALGFPDGATMRLRGFDGLCYFRSKFDRFAPK